MKSQHVETFCLIQISQIARLLQSVHQAEITVSNMHYSPINSDVEGIFSWFGQGMFSNLTFGGQGSHGHHLQDDIGPVDTQKLSRFLKNTIENLSEVFQVSLFYQ